MPRCSLAMPMRVFLSLCLAAAGLTGGCTRFQLLDATIPSCGYTRTTDVPYGDRPRQKLDVYRPRAAAPGAGVVVFFYGGDWQTGSKADYRFVAEALTSRGFVAVLPDYRLHPEVTFPAFVEDAARAVRWARDHAAEFGGDPGRVFLMGHSAGAHIAALLALDAHYLGAVGLDRSAVRAMAGLAGPYDFVPPPDDRGVFGMGRGDTIPDPRIEPIGFADGRAPPLLLLQGDADETVDPANAPKLAARQRAAGGRVRVITYRGRGHVGIVLALAYPFRWLDPVLDDVAAFFRAAPPAGGAATAPAADP